MAETATSTATATPTPKPPAAVTIPKDAKANNGMLLSPNGNIIVWVEGRIEKSARVAQTKEGRPIFETVVCLPAPDAYSHPRRYCVSSYHSIGRDGDDVNAVCELVCQPWKPRSQNVNAGNYNGNRHPNAPPGYYDDGYAGNGNGQQARPASSDRWRYPHYLWLID